MVFVELPVFTRQIDGHLTDEDLHRLQMHLMAYPQAGSLIKGSGGMRKMRVALTGRGTRGGGRIIYYYLAPDQRIYLLFFYPKNKQADLTPGQLRTLKQMIESP